MRPPRGSSAVRASRGSIIRTSNSVSGPAARRSRRCASAIPATSRAVPTTEASETMSQFGLASSERRMGTTWRSRTARPESARPTDVRVETSSTADATGAGEAVSGRAFAGDAGRRAFEARDAPTFAREGSPAWSGCALRVEGAVGTLPAPVRSAALAALAFASCACALGADSGSSGPYVAPARTSVAGGLRPCADEDDSA